MKRIAGAVLTAFLLLPAEVEAQASQWRAGSRVTCNWRGLGTQYPGMVLARMGDRVSILYDDGDHEVTASSRCRLVGGPQGARSSGSLGGLSVGDRVSCNWQREGSQYTGRVDLILGQKIRVLYDEGDEELTIPSLCRAVSSGAGGGVATDGFAPGARVQCNWKSIGIYFPGTVSSRNGNRLQILYDDGDREETTTGHCRTR